MWQQSLTFCFCWVLALAGVALWLLKLLKAEKEATTRGVVDASVEPSPPVLLDAAAAAAGHDDAAADGRSAEAAADNAAARVLAPLAASPRARVCDPLAKTCAALYDARDQVRKRTHAALFDEVPLRLRAAGGALQWRDASRRESLGFPVRFDLSVQDRARRRRGEPRALLDARAARVRS